MGSRNKAPRGEQATERELAGLRRVAGERMDVRAIGRPVDGRAGGNHSSEGEGREDRVERVSSVEIAHLLGLIA